MIDMIPKMSTPRIPPEMTTPKIINIITPIITRGINVKKNGPIKRNMKPTMIKQIRPNILPLYS